jgi:predicted enzyme related to lactoylglutathione lyase
MEMTRYEHGTPSWVDIGTPDLEGAIAFYSALFGWLIEVGDPEMGRYSMATIDGKVVAALADQQQPGPPWWATYISVDDIDDVVARVEKAGGSVIVPVMEIPEAGRMAVAMDAGGAAISFWEPGQHTGAQLVNEPGTLCWNELTTRAVDASIAFYGDVLGWTASPLEGSEVAYYEWKRGGTTVAGMMPMVGEMWPADLPNHWMVYFAVDDADATAERCTELGGAVSVPPTDIPVGRFAVLNDPQGAFFSIIRMADAPPA